jgi:ankyrin repeat protein
MRTTLTEVAKLLLDRDDINVNLQDNEGWTALIRACEDPDNVSFRILKWLVKMHASLLISLAGCLNYAVAKVKQLEKENSELNSDFLWNAKVRQPELRMSSS